MTYHKAISIELDEKVI